jgi:hypothetical protein
MKHMKAVLATNEINENPALPWKLYETQALQRATVHADGSTRQAEKTMFGNLRCERIRSKRCSHSYKTRNRHSPNVVSNHRQQQP